MSTRFWIAAVIYMMAQAVVFGTGAVLVLATPLKEMAMQLMPVVVLSSAILAAPIAWMIAPRMRARFWRNPTPASAKLHLVR